MNFIEDLQLAWRRANSLVCVGLDPEPARFPEEFGQSDDAVFDFCRAIIDATADVVCCFKPQIAYFSAQRAESALERLIAYIHATYPAVPVILDAKRGDIGSTADQYVTEAFTRYGADAVTLSPYLGRDSVQPFLDRADKGAVILCHTSNAGAQDLQELVVAKQEVVPRPLYQQIAQMVARDWNTNGNCLLVVGATYAQQLAEVRALVSDMPLLVPGVGAQGGDVAAVVRNGRDSRGEGLIVSSSRAILYASRDANYAVAARNATIALRDEINRWR